MPQLDLLTFFTQFFWSVLCLFLFYFFVSKLILPELTRVLKYRSKAATFSTHNDKSDLAVHLGEKEVSDNLAHSSGRSGSLALYQYACASSTRVLIQARQKRDTFLSKVTSGKVTRTDKDKKSNAPSPSLSSESLKNPSKSSKALKSAKTSKAFKNSKDA